MRGLFFRGSLAHQKPRPAAVERPQPPEVSTSAGKPAQSQPSPPWFPLWNPLPRRPLQQSGIPKGETHRSRERELGRVRQPTGPGLARQRRAAARTPDSRAYFGPTAPGIPDSCKDCARRRARRLSLTRRLPVRPRSIPRARRCAVRLLRAGCAGGTLSARPHGKAPGRPQRSVPI
jgi:hypothetical protein